MTFKPVLEGRVGDSWTRKEEERTSRTDRAEDTAPTIHCPEASWGQLCEEHLWGHKCARTGSDWHVVVSRPTKKLCLWSERAEAKQAGEWRVAGIRSSLSYWAPESQRQWWGPSRRKLEGRALGLEREVYNRDPSKELGLFLGVTGSHGEHLSERGFVSF